VPRLASQRRFTQLVDLIPVECDQTGWHVFDGVEGGEGPIARRQSFESRSGRQPKRGMGSFQVGLPRRPRRHGCRSEQPDRNRTASTVTCDEERRLDENGGALIVWQEATAGERP